MLFKSAIYEIEINKFAADYEYTRITVQFQNYRLRLYSKTIMSSAHAHGKWLGSERVQIFWWGRGGFATLWALKTPGNCFALMFLLIKKKDMVLMINNSVYVIVLVFMWPVSLGKKNIKKPRYIFLGNIEFPSESLS